MDTPGSKTPFKPFDLAANSAPEPNRKIPTEPPAPGETTGKQAAQFQPTNMAVMAGVIGLGEPWGNSWSWQQAPLSSPYGSTPAPAVFTNYTINGLPVAWPGQYSYFRKILNDATVRFVRALAFVPVLSTPWVVRQNHTKAPKEAAEMIQDMVDHLRLQFIDDALRGVDFGWCGFEQCFELVERGPHKGAFWLKKMKPLMHDITSIYTTEHGNFNGFNNNGTIIDPDKSVLFTYDGESGNLYGRGRCWNLLEVVPWWRDANDGAAKYDRKIAGVFLVCHYPPGSSVDRDGKLRENWEIAQQIIDSVQAGVPIAVCNEFAGEMENNFLQNISMADRTRWKLELLEDKGSRQPGFGDRLTYLDRQKARAYLVPERSAFEAQRSGSRADSEQHSDVVLLNASILGDKFTRLLNGSDLDITSPINNLLRVNWGESAIGTVEVKTEAMDKDKKEFFQSIVNGVLSDSPEFLGQVSDISQVFAGAGMPIPSDPTTNEELTVKLDGIMAKKVKVAGKVPGANGKGKETLARIREAALKLAKSQENGR